MGGISVIIPVFNVAEYLPDCLDSLVGAGLPRGVEIILVNDGSTDGSAAICRDFADAHGAVFVRQKNAGAAAARNAGIQLARGDYLLFVDGDDLVYNGAIGRLAAILENAAPVDINFLNADIINANGHVKKWSYRYNNDKLGEN
ncbi:MAG: glycosyltransferase, partial [Defluviitaleaceae bacterium]|nr:glycosyltransferase [Defluviitaleaceae bacterium]